MPSIDERLRKELERIASPADPSDALERVAEKRARRRVVRRAQRATLVVAVLAGTIAGAYGLTLVFPSGPAGGVGGSTSPSVTSSPADPRTAIGPACGISELSADLDGDGAPDTLLAYAPVDQGVSCDDPDLSLAYRMSAFLATGERFDQAIPDCTWPYACRPFAAPDVDGDGSPEIAVQTMAGASTVQVRLYETVGQPWEGPMQAIRVSPPGDPDGGFPPGPATFELYGSVTHLGSLRCETGPEGSPALVYSAGIMQEPGTYRVHETWFTLEGGWLGVMDVRDDTVTDTDPRFRRLEQGSDVCGAPIAS